LSSAIQFRAETFGRVMRQERAMVKAIVDRNRYRPGVTFADDELSAIEQPTLMLFGSADPVGSRALWDRVISALPRGELVVIEGAGHMVWLDDPAGVARRMEAFAR
jgi:pimeloyl-ACP methyl ester carboxylesterase